MPIVTNGDVQPVTSSFESGRIGATFENASGEIQVRHNWYPRWTAFADGEEVPVRRTDAGTMTITVPDDAIDEYATAIAIDFADAPTG